MKNALLAIATAAAVLTAAPLLAGTAKADPMRLAQADVDVRIGGRDWSAGPAATATVSW
jgi:ABC-type proline/glycine betaine transport system substrate-binding protein